MNPAKKSLDISKHVHSSSFNNEAVNSRYPLFSSLDVDQIRQEIAACDALLQNLGESSDKSRLNSSGYDSREELNVQPKVCERNILEAFNSSFKFGKSKSIDQVAGVQIKRELDDDSITSVCSSKGASLFSSNKNDKLDSLCNAAQISTENNSVKSSKLSSDQSAYCNVPLADLSYIKREKEGNNSIQSKSLCVSIASEASAALDGDTINNQKVKAVDYVSNTNTNLVLQSETKQNLAQNSQSVDIDKLALSIKKEVYGEAKTRSSNYGIKDQNDLIQKAQTGKAVIAPQVSDNTFKTKSICSMPSHSSHLKQRGNSVDDDDDEIQILRIANEKTSKEVPIVDLTEDNNIPDSISEIQEKISGNKSKLIPIPSMHANTAQVGTTLINSVQGCSTKVSALQSSVRQVNTAQTSTVQGHTAHSSLIQSRLSQINSRNACEELNELNKVIKAENSNFPSNVISTPVKDPMLEEISYLEDQSTQAITKRKGGSLPTEIEENHRKLVLLSNEDTLNSPFTEKEDVPVTGELHNSAIARDKYFEDFFKHPFPPSLVLYNTKQRNTNKMYTRINSKAWNLSVEEVETRLKLSENTVPHLGKKLGDVVRLEKYPVSVSEVECYHRILGVAPSHKLLSKCFKSPAKTVNTLFKSGFNVCPSVLQGNVNVIEKEKQFNKMTCSLDDILKGISETKMMYSTNNIENSVSVFEKDGPSTDTRDSCDSYVSNISSIQSRELKISDNLNEVNNECIQSSSHNDTNSNGKSSTLSCRPLGFNESDFTNLSFLTIKSSTDQLINSLNSNENVNPYPPQNVLNYLNLPSQEAINNIINSTERSSTCVAPYNTAIKYSPELRSNTIKSIESQSSSNSCQSFKTSLGYKANDESNLQGEKKQVFDIDLPVTELRKILETAGSLYCDVANYDEGCAWKGKATFEYNHTQSVPVVKKNVKCNNLGTKVIPSEIAPSCGFASQPFPEQYKECDRQANTVSQSTSNDCTNTVKDDVHTFESEQSSSAKKTAQEDSDSDCVDNEPICNDDYDRERDENSSHIEEHAVPQYKSKWEKIMERKSLESKKREIVNEHLLKDCFPVSSTKSRKISHLSSKNVCKSSEEPEKPPKGTNEKKHNKDHKIDLQVKNVKKNASKSNTTKQNNKSSQSSKVEKNRSQSISGKESKNKTSMSKENKGSVDDVSSLFAPDKRMKSVKGLKSDAVHQASENNKSKRFYGNRVTNRGTFLTESSSSSELLKKIKIPKKKKLENPKKHFSVRSEEFHSMVKSPDINIGPTFNSSYTHFNKSLDSRKSSETYKSPLENTASSVSSHFVRTRQMRDRRKYHSNFQPEERQPPRIPYCSDPRLSKTKSLLDENKLGRKVPLLNTPSNISPLLNNESSLNRKIALLSTPSIPSLINDESTVNRKTSQFGILPSISSHPSNDESLLGKMIPNIITLPSIKSQLPMESFPPNANSQMNLLHTIISTINNNKISSVPNVNEDELPYSDCINPWDKYESNSYESSTRQSLNVQSVLPCESSVSASKSYGNIPPLDFFETLKSSSTHSFSAVPPKNPFDSPDILNSPPFSAPVNASTHVPSQPNRKATCLVPQHLKTLVGHDTIDTHNVRLLMLEWSVDWLMQQQQFHDPPPISNALKKVVSSYDSFEDFYNTYFPLMLLDTWQRIYVSWTHLNQANPYSCQITSYSVKSQYVSVECQTVFNTAAHPKGVFPDEGSILMVKYSTKSNEYTIKILGYVTNVKTRRFNCVTDSKLFSSLRSNKDANPDVLQILSLTFMGAYNSEDIDKRQPVRIHVLCNVKPTLKQNDAMLYINNSPLQRSILNPVADGLLSFTLTPRNSPLEKISECVRDITKGILSPHPLPLLTVVRAKPESDRLNIIPMLIEKMKSAYKTKVLLCVRTVRALGDIAANICLHQSLKLVIINKRCDTNPQFQKYLLDDLASAEVSKCSEDKGSEKPHVKNDVVVKVKKQVLKECDVVLSLIRNCHDDFLGETFTETDCVSQMCCIVDEANLCTEPESLIPILHGISKLILIGDPDYPAKVLSKTASAYDYSQSFFQRAYDLDLITE